MKRLDEDDDQKLVEEQPILIDLYDLRSKKLEMDKPYRLPKIPDLSEELAGTVH